MTSGSFSSGWASSCPARNKTGLALRSTVRWKQEVPLAETKDGMVLSELEESAKSV